MSKSNTFENDFLQLIFNAVAITGLAQNHASPTANLYVSFHTADPGEAGDQTTNEASYTSYARVAVVRTSSGWVVSGNSVSPAADVSAPASTGGSTTSITHVGIGTASSGAGKLLYKGALDAAIVMSSGVQPILGAGTVVTED